MWKSQIKVKIILLLNRYSKYAFCVLAAAIPAVSKATQQQIRIKQKQHFYIFCITNRIHT